MKNMNKIKTLSHYSILQENKSKAKEKKHEQQQK